MTKESEFGAGVVYPLGLFLAHERQLGQQIKSWKTMHDKTADKTLFKEEDAVELWFNAAADHLFEFMPKHAPKHLQKRCETLKNKALGWRLIMGSVKQPRTEDASWAIKEAKDLLLEIDLHNKVPAIKGSWE